MAEIKDKVRILKARGERQLVTYKGTPVRPSAEFSAETLQVRKGWHDIFKVMKGKKKSTIKNTLPSKVTIKI